MKPASRMMRRSSSSLAWCCAPAAETTSSRFDISNIETAERYNGIVQQEYIVDNPTFFPTIPTIAQLLAMPGIQSTQTVQEISSRLRAPYIMQSALTVERQ